MARGVAFFVAAVAFATSGCSGDDCSDSDCAAGNRCIDDGTSNKCRLLCDKQSICPLNYYCAATDDGRVTYCAETSVKYARSERGQWGAGCSPTAGLEENPACDLDQQFWCYGESPTDGAAYCTQFECSADEQCGAGFYCGRVNLGPNVRTVRRTFGTDKTIAVCLKREYCAPCRHDIDCLPIDGVNAHCVKGTDGVGFCTPECSNQTSCRGDAKCVPDDALGVGVCMPRAGTCKGDGSFCSPCRSDADCPTGICGEHEFSHERYCTVKSRTPCDEGGTSPSGCPTQEQNPSGARVACVTSRTSTIAPKDHCVGLVQFGATGESVLLPGCWTAATR